jgi:hypothetical protein
MLIKFRSVALNPTPDGHVIHTDVPFRHDLFEITQAQSISKITTNAQNDDLGFEMSPFEQRWPLPSHEGPSLSDRSRRFATHPRCYY